MTINKKKLSSPGNDFRFRPCHWLPVEATLHWHLLILRHLSSALKSGRALRFPRLNPNTCHRRDWQPRVRLTEPRHIHLVQIFPHRGIVFDGPKVGRRLRIFRLDRVDRGPRNVRRLALFALNTAAVDGWLVQFDRKDGAGTGQWRRGLRFAKRILGHTVVIVVFNEANVVSVVVGVERVPPKQFPPKEC